MDPFHAFVECRRAATRRLTTGRNITLAPVGQRCYTHEHDALLLCDSCLAFWRECVENEDQTSWLFAVYLRDPSGPDKVARDLAPSQNHLLGAF